MLGGSGTGAALFGGGVAAVAALHRVVTVVRLEHSNGGERGAAVLAALLLMGMGATNTRGLAKRSDAEYLVARLRGQDPGTAAAYERLSTLDGYGPTLARAINDAARPNSPFRPAEATAVIGRQPTSSASAPRARSAATSPTSCW